MKPARTQRSRDRRSHGNGGPALRKGGNGEGNTRNGARGVDLRPLNGSIGYTVRRAQLALFADFVTSLREVNLRPGQFGVLMVVHGNPGLSQSDICAALGIQKTNLVPLIRGLESRGLIVRKPGLQDRRSYALHLTARGRNVMRRALDLQASQEARLTEQLGESGRATLLTLLGQLLAGTGGDAAGRDFALN
jgi:DNA-binding MarR family transcriptional regulator